jgi:monoamine oxidase
VYISDGYIIFIFFTKLTAQMNRREFLKQAALATGGIIVANTGAGYFFGNTKTKVIIIGAGFAGLAAAYELHKRKISYVILESRSRIGGRVFSHKIDDVENLTIELGGEWVGDSHERMHALVKEFGLELGINRMKSHLIYKGKHSPVGQWGYSDAWQQKFKRLVSKDFKHLAGNYWKLTETQKREIDRIDWWRYLVNNGCDEVDLDLRELLDSTDFGESIRHVSAFAALAEYAESSEHNEMDWKIKGGNAMLAEKFADKIGRNKIRLAHTVRSITQRKNVIVRCDNGQTFEAAKLICTVPTFAMKSIKWDPVLPREKINAINELQYARINKNAMLFSDRFWQKEDFDMVTDTPVHYLYHATQGQQATKGVLIGYSIGDKADVIAKQSDEWRKELLEHSLKPAFPGLTSKLEKQVSYYWGEDKYSRGSYAVYGKGQWFDTRATLAKSFMHTHFAGEHIADWQGFMEGAVATGEEAAGRC